MKITWLHVSDFHMGDGDSYDRDRVLDALVKAVGEQRTVHGRRPNLIVATGDIAHSGKATQYKSATAFFDKLLAAAGLERCHLFVVPGNHDVDRTKGVGLARTLDSRENADEYFAPGFPKPHLTQKLGAFRDWYNDYFAGIRELTADTTCPRVETVDIDGLRVALMMLNTALFAQDDQDHNKLVVGRRCLGAAIEQLNTLHAAFKMALMHHPLEWISGIERQNIKESLHEAVNVILHGHLHETEVASVASSSGGVVYLGAGAAYQTRRYPDRALYTTLEGNQLRVFPLRYEDSSREVWTLDPSVFPHEPGYEGLFVIPRLAESLSPALASAGWASVSPAGGEALKTANQISEHSVQMPVPPIPANMADRGGLLRWMHETLADLPKQKAVHLWGLGGIGKTTLAAAYLDRYAPVYKHRLWFDLNGDVTPSLQEFLELAGYAVGGMKTDEIKRIVRVWLSRNSDWILVLNGLIDADQPIDFLPLDYKGTVLVTSRERWLFREAKDYEVRELDEGASRQYLLAATGHPDEAGAGRLAVRLAGYPLALEMAAAYLREEWRESHDKSGSFDEYLRLLDQNPKMALAGDERFSHYPFSLSTVFEVSVKRVPQSRRALERAALLASTAMDRRWLIAERPRTEQKNIAPRSDSVSDRLIEQERLVLEPLFRAALLRREERDKAGIHPLLQDWLQAEMSASVRRDRLTELGAILCRNALFDPYDLQTWGPFRQLLPHAQQVATRMSRAGIMNHEHRFLSLLIGAYLQEIGNYRQALTYVQDAKAVVAYLEKRKTSAWADCLTAEGAALNSLGEFRRAADVLQRALGIYRTTVGPNHPNVASALDILATSYANLGDPRQAIKLSEQALQIREKLGGANHPEVATMLDNLGLRYYELGYYHKAIEIYQQALSIQGTVLGPEHPRLASTLNNLALAHLAVGEPVTAMELSRRALQIEEAALGSHQPEIARNLATLGTTCAMLGQASETVSHFERALDLFASDPEAMQFYYECLAEYGWATWLLGVTEESLNRLLNARDSLVAHYGEAHPLVAKCAARIAQMYERMGQLVQSVAEQQKAVDIFLRSFGPDAPRTKEAQSRLEQLRRLA